MSNDGEPTRGFGHTRRRVALELGLVLGALVGLVLLVTWSAKNLAGWLTPFVPLDVDRVIGEQAWPELAPEAERCSKQEPLHYVEQLLQALPRCASSGFELKIAVVDVPEVNAFALPGGYVTVNFGLLEKAKSGEEVLGVLAHELAHVHLRHGTERILRETGTAVAVGLVFGNTDFSIPSALLTNLASSAYDRKQETEADDQGVASLRDAGVDALGMARFFERMAQESPSIPVLLSTHPDPGDRAERARLLAANSPVTRTLPPPTGLRCR
jgi:predicted Zn-dependent protease